MRNELIHRGDIRSISSDSHNSFYGSLLIFPVTSKKRSTLRVALDWLVRKAKSVHSKKTLRTFGNNLKKVFFERLPNAIAIRREVCGRPISPTWKKTTPNNQ
jgi:hypothetical protein